jgi:hypothetical protein
MVDLKNNYSTKLYAERVITIVEEHDLTKGPLFVYAAFQSVYGARFPTEIHARGCH